MMTKTAAVEETKRANAKKAPEDRKSENIIIRVTVLEKLKIIENAAAVAERSECSNSRAIAKILLESNSAAPVDNQEEHQLLRKLIQIFAAAGIKADLEQSEIQLIQKIFAEGI